LSIYVALSSFSQMPIPEHFFCLLKMNEQPANVFHFMTIVCMLIVLMFTLSGCRSPSLQKDQAVSPQLEHQPQDANEATKQIEVHVFEDEAMLRGTQAVIGGTIKNTSDENLESISIELELKHRDNDTTEIRKLSVLPSSLLPNAQGRYQITLPTREWSGARLLRVLSASRDSDIIFASFPGARRPPERSPQIRVNSASPSRPKSKGEEFINTPDTPSSIP
jgi:hypothetical protein